MRGHTTRVHLVLPRRIALFFHIYSCFVAIFVVLYRQIIRAQEQAPGTKTEADKFMAKYTKDFIDNTVSDAFISAAVAEHIESAQAAGKSPVIYANESNGIQALPLLADMGVLARFCYIRSTHFERKCVGTAVKDLPEDLLLSCAMGDDILVIDYGTRKDRSRAIYQGIPFVKYCLDRAWLDIVPERVFIYPRTNAMDRKQNATMCFDKWYLELGGKVLTKINRYRDIAKEHLAGQDSGVMLRGVSAATTHDGEKNYHARLKREYLMRMQNALIMS